MLDGLLRLIRLHLSIVVSGPLGAGGLLGLFCAFGRFLGVLRTLFANGASSFPLEASGPPFFIAARILSRPSLFKGEHASQTLMPFSSKVSSRVLSQLWSILLAISSSSALFRRAASAVSVSPAFSARRSRSW